MTPEEELYVKKLEADLSKFQALYEGTKERNDIIFYKGEKDKREVVHIVEIVTDDDGKIKEKSIRKFLNDDSLLDVKYVLAEMGHYISVRSMPEMMMAELKTKIYRLEDKHPKLYKMLWLVIKPWRAATCVYDIILAVIANLILLAILLSPVLLFL